MSRLRLTIMLVALYLGAHAGEAFGDPASPSPAATADASKRSALPAATASVVEVTTGGSEATSGAGPLRIRYSDGTVLVIPNESGNYAIDDVPVPQESFSEVQVADDRQHVGWLADYRMCAQSYACSMELVVYRARHETRHFAPSHGVVFTWQFLNGGEQVKVEGGFPHGDEGDAVIYDVSSGREVKTREAPAENTKASKDQGAARP